jgi:hypothetical protein
MRVNGFGMKDWQRRGEEPRRWRHATLGALLALLVLSVSEGNAVETRSSRRPLRFAERGPVYQFLAGSGIPIEGEIRLAKITATLRTGYAVRSVVKLIGPENLPAAADLEEMRKRIRQKMLQGERIKPGTYRMPSELELLRENILAGEVIEFHPSPKLGELELFFSRTQSVKIEIGEDMFYIRIGNRDCTFRSASLRRQLNNILQRREARPGERTEGGSGRRRPPR